MAKSDDQNRNNNKKVIKDLSELLNNKERITGKPASEKELINSGELMTKNSHGGYLDVEHSIIIPADVESNNQEHTGKVELKAKAPYNFIPINDKIVKSCFNTNDTPLDVYHQDRHTGYISISILTKTQIYIRSLLTEEESNRLDYLEDRIKNEKNKDDLIRLCEEKLNLTKHFYSPGKGISKLPGSSIRGLIRSGVEIASFGKFGFTEKERKYHYRSMADRSADLKRKYADDMLIQKYNVNGNSLGYTQKVNAGYLVESGNSYRIKPVDSPATDCQFFRVEENDVINSGVLHTKMTVMIRGRCEGNPSYSSGFKRIKFTYAPAQTHQHSCKLYYSKVTSIYAHDDPAAPLNCLEGTLVYTGWMRNKRQGKHLHWVIGPAGRTTIDFLPGVISDYRNDESRKKEANLLEWFKIFNVKEVPCFYIEENGKVKSFGHTGIFRLAYEKNVGSFLPNNHQQEDVLDIAESIFGKENMFPGRLFFEDADFVSSEEPNPYTVSGYPQILSTPKPTTVQHYIVQKEIVPIYNVHNGIYQGVRGLKDYNSSDVSLRGIKLYWHKSEMLPYAERGSFEDNPRQYTFIEPIDKGAAFVGKIRFENLSDVELGALLFALDLPEECCHKIGMGKPLGLGSIRIAPELYLSNRYKRYTNILFEWLPSQISSASESSIIGSLKNAFAKYILNNLDDNTTEHEEMELWKVERMKELRTMLNFEQKPDYEETRYMEIEKKQKNADGVLTKVNEYKERPVLPKPSGVKNIYN